MMRTGRRMKKKRRLGLFVLAAVLIAGAGALLCLARFLAPYTEQTMDMSLLDISTVDRPSVLYAYQPDERGERSGELHTAPCSDIGDRRLRIHVSYEDVPPELINAFIAIEDKRFWEHDGVDLLRTVRAGARYLMGTPSFGGSTITQQLIKNLTGDDDHSVDRKLKEIFKALDLETRIGKEEILEAYLNVINLAEGCYGVGAAAERYFSKSVSELTLVECAALAAITNNPTRYDPLTHPQNNRNRRNTILREMAEQGYITPEERDAALDEELCLHPSPKADPSPPTSWYVDLVVTDVIRDLQERLGYSYAAASGLVYGGGLRIETAMDQDLQAAVEDYYEDTGNFPGGDAGRPQSAMILMDPQTGDILAVAGAIGSKTAHRIQNYATDTRRPAGSCIKPLTVYAPALHKGILNWATVYEDEPLCEKGGKPWPANADGRYRGKVSVGEAVAHSLNPVAVRILEQVGAEYALSFARERLGLESLLEPTEGSARDLTLSSLALGQQSRGVTVREMVAAYTVFTDGFYRPPVSYHRVLDACGRVLLENPVGGGERRVLSVENAALMTRLLMEVTEEGTAAQAMTMIREMGIQCAGKTGTTQNNCDRWFIGYTPRLLAGVWMGYDYPAEMKGIYGNPCVTVWDQVMTACESVYRGTPPKTAFDTPEDLIQLEFCPLSGKLVSPYCTDPIYGHRLETGWFLRGREPRETCDVHKEPPLTLIPEDPRDPLRIPLLPEDLLPDEEREPQPSEDTHRKRRWLDFFERVPRPFWEKRS